MKLVRNLKTYVVHRDIPLWLPTWLFRRRMNRAMRRYRKAIVALFDVQVAAINAGEPYK